MWLPEYLEKEGNALLKMIEEPPEKTLFLLVAENQEKILNTIISRTQLVKINTLSHQAITSYLIESKHLEESEAREIAFIADGNVQEAINMIDLHTNNHFDLLVRWLRLVVQDSGLNIISICEDELAKLGRENQKTFLMYAINIMRQIVLIKQDLSSLVFLPSHELDFVNKFATHYTLEQIEETINLFETTHYSVERNANPKILFLDLSLQLVLMFKYKTFPKGTQYI
jgi:DNA polymerase-3 subunit delta'